MSNHITLIKKMFWLICLPFVGTEALYFFIQKMNPLFSKTFLFFLLLLIPMMIVKTNEFGDEAFENLLNEFRNMPNQEFAEREQEIMNLPHSTNSGLFKEAYRQVYRDKYGKDFNDRFSK